MTKEQQREIDKMNDMLKKLNSGQEVVCNICGEGIMRNTAGRSYACSICGSKLRLGEPINREQ